MELDFGDQQELDNLATTPGFNAQSLDELIKKVGQQVSSETSNPDLPNYFENPIDPFKPSAGNQPSLKALSNDWWLQHEEPASQQVDPAAAGRLAVKLEKKQKSPAAKMAAGRGALLASREKVVTDVNTGGSLNVGTFIHAIRSEKGTPYQWGGVTPGQGVDCSGLIVSAMRKAGFGHFARYTAASLAEHSKAISIKDALKIPGALLFINEGGRIGHVAVSIGNGRDIEAAHTGTVVHAYSAAGRGFTSAGLLPEIDYSGSFKGIDNQPVHKHGKGGHRPGEPTINLANAGGDPFTNIPTAIGMVSESFGQRAPKAQTMDIQQYQGSRVPSYVPKQFRPYFIQAAQQTGVPVGLLAAVALHESSFRKDAVSPAGAQGIMQIMPSHGLSDPFNAADNIMKGAEILRSYIGAAGGNFRLGLAYYNAGPNAAHSTIQSVMHSYVNPIFGTWRGARVA